MLPGTCYKCECQSSPKVRLNRVLHPITLSGVNDLGIGFQGGRLAGAASVPPNFFHLPLGYNGRASSVVVSGTPIARPYGMMPGKESGIPGLMPSKRLDYEVEMGIFISKPVRYGESVPARRTRDHIFGLVLLNDWSARDIQMYEMTPLGPFNGKACGTSISPWVVSLDALEESGAIVTAEVGGLHGGKATSVKFLACQDDLDIEVSASISRMFESFVDVAHARHLFRLMICHGPQERTASTRLLSAEATSSICTGHHSKWWPIIHPLVVA